MPLIFIHQSPFVNTTISFIIEIEHLVLYVSPNNNVANANVPSYQRNVDWPIVARVIIVFLIKQQRNCGLSLVSSSLLLCTIMQHRYETQLLNRIKHDLSNANYSIHTSPITLPVIPRCLATSPLSNDIHIEALWTPKIFSEKGSH